MISAAIRVFIIGVRTYIICTVANAKANSIELGIRKFKFDWLLWDPCLWLVAVGNRRKYPQADRFIQEAGNLQIKYL